MNLKNKTSLITGASRGIGRAIAQSFAKAGSDVIVHYNQDQNAAEETLRQLPSGNHYIIQANVEDAQSLQVMVNQISRQNEKIDILVNNAGIYETYDVMALTFAQWQDIWQRTLSINLTGAANLSFLIAREMNKNHSGRIINISSRGAFRGEPNAVAYGASKAGMNAMGQSLAVALAPFGISVYTIAPGFVQTDMTETILQGPEGENIRQQIPLGRVASPEELAKTALFLASDAPPSMTGCIIDINGASYLRT